MAMYYLIERAGKVDVVPVDGLETFVRGTDVLVRSRGHVCGSLAPAWRAPRGLNRSQLYTLDDYVRCWVSPWQAFAVVSCPVLVRQSCGDIDIMSVSLVFEDRRAYIELTDGSLLYAGDAVNISEVDASEVDEALEGKDWEGYGEGFFGFEHINAFEDRGRVAYDGSALRLFEPDTDAYDVLVDVSQGRFDIAIRVDGLYAWGDTIDEAYERMREWGGLEELPANTDYVYLGTFYHEGDGFRVEHLGRVLGLRGSLIGVLDQLMERFRG